MLCHPHVKGFIFDFDDTLLNNYYEGTLFGLHERSRLAAAHEVGRRRGLKSLQRLTRQHAINAFLQAPIYTLDAIVWEMLLLAGEVQSPEIDHVNPLLRELVDLKEALHDNILRTYGQEIPGATKFIKALADNGFRNRLAIASASCRRDIDTFLTKMNLHDDIPATHVISREICQASKPHPEPYNRAFAALALHESQRPHIIALEDDPRGIQSAKAAGLYTCAITTRLKREVLACLPVAPDLIVDSFAQLESLLKLPLIVR